MLKRNLTIALSALLAVFVLGGCAGSLDSQPLDLYARAPAGGDVSYFYDVLAPYGEWIRTDRYGLVWCPYDKQVDWRPYTDGEWVWTDYGWAWAADEDWGWATYHYGRWYDDPYDGWCWMPGRQWAPAWVAWREGGGWVGWAPLPPELAWGNGGWMGHNDWDHLPGVEHHWWSFCREGELPGPGIGRRLAPRHRAVVLIDQTRNITSYSYVNARFANRSLDVAPIRRAYGQDIAMRRIADVAAPPADHGSQITRDTYNAYRPRMKEPTAGSVPTIVRRSRPATTEAEQVIRTPRAAPDAQRVEAAELRRRAAADREQMERDQAQAQENRQRAAGIDAERLRRQQERERKALEDQTERDERVLRSRRGTNPRDERPAPERDERTAPERTERPVKRDGRDPK